MALGNYIRNIAGKEKIALITSSIINIIFTEVINAIRNKYPYANIIDNDTDEVLIDTSSDLEAKETFISQWINTKNQFSPMNSIFDKYFKRALALIDNYQDCNIIYEEFDNSFWMKVNIQLESFNQSDNNIINFIVKAIQTTVENTNQYFYNNNIDNLLIITKPYTLMLN